MNTEEKTIKQFTGELASTLPAPGGGGAAALAGALAAALASMAAGLTADKKKFENIAGLLREDISRCCALKDELLALIDRDEEGFLPLAGVYSLPKDTPDYEKLRHDAVLNAVAAPFSMLRKITEAAELSADLCGKVSRLMLSDAGCAASLCCAAAECAAMNIYVNTRLLPGDPEAEAIAAETERLLAVCRQTAGPAAADVLKTLSEG